MEYANAQQLKHEFKHFREQAENMASVGLFPSLRARQYGRTLLENIYKHRCLAENIENSPSLKQDFSAEDLTLPEPPAGNMDDPNSGWWV